MGVFSCRDGTQGLSLRWGCSPPTAVWGWGRYPVNSRVNQIYPSNSIPVALRLLVWVNVGCCSKGLQRWAPMERGKGWWGATVTSEVCRTARPSVMIIPALGLKQHFPIAAYGTNSLWILPWSFVCSAGRREWKEYERSLHTTLNPGWGEDTSAPHRHLADDCTASGRKFKPNPFLMQNADCFATTD